MENYKTIKQAELEINPPKIDIRIEPINQEQITKLQTELTKQSVYNKIRLLVNTTSNDLELGAKVRKLFF